MDEKVIGEKKPLNKKVIIGIVAALAILIIILVVVFATGNDGDVAKGSEEKNGPVANTNAEIIKEFDLEGLKFSNISVITEGTTSFVTMDVTNPTGSVIKMESIDIMFKDKEGNEIATLLGYFGGEVPAGETRVISSQAEIDLTGAITREITINEW